MNDDWLDDDLDNDPELQAGTQDYGVLDAQEGTRAVEQADVAIDELIPPCPDCGRRPSEYAPGADWQRQVLELQSQNPIATRIAQGVAVYLCNSCLEKREAIMRSENRMAQIRGLVKHTYASKLMPASARHCQWSNSNPEIEDRNTDAWNTARSFVLARGNAWISGHPGTGKTFMARCIANNMLAMGYSAGELSAHEIRAWTMNTLDHNIRKWSAPHLLVIDDMDKIHISDWTLSNLLQLMNNRMDIGGRRLVVTANTTGSMLAATWKNVASPIMATTITSIFERILPATGITITGGSNRVRTLT